jgi:hypothetical protein
VGNTEPRRSFQDRMGAGVRQQAECCMFMGNDRLK